MSLNGMYEQLTNQELRDEINRAEYWKAHAFTAKPGHSREYDSESQRQARENYWRSRVTVARNELRKREHNGQ